MTADVSPLPRYLLDRWPGVEPNVLRLGLTKPYVRLAMTLNGPERTAERRELKARSTGPRLTPFTNLIIEVVHNDPILIRGDVAEPSGPDRGGRVGAGLLDLKMTPAASLRRVGAPRDMID